ncbi:ALBINO3-like protein 2, chloroplastic [Cannabis sativa]|uniref:ALBINO3-like protein 2, chloroplastic n=1 Tax=Cannabis sativa TaxID=3483 RepID=UPI0029CA4C5B|nr:ALBINO3-like protein 2, chloroplastic [Cannabis sativa]
MASYKILKRLRRSIQANYLSHKRDYHLLNILNSNSSSVSYALPFSSHLGKPNLPLKNPYSLLLNSRAITTQSEDDSVFGEARAVDSHHSITVSPELIAESNVMDEALSISCEESMLPVRLVSSMLDGFHEFSGLPWWVVIASSTLALRAVLFPLLIFQLHKLKRIGELFNKLPSPFPEPLSGKGYIDHLSHFMKEKKAIGCPSFLWFLPYVCVQVPCFFLWMTTVRRMSLDHHPGFDCGGAFWFQNLTEFSHGISGSIFPVVIAGLHYTNVQISFRKSAIKKVTSLLDLLVKYYKHYLDFLTLPILLSCYFVPQGSLVYWVTNSSLTAIQQLSLKNPDVLVKLGLSDKITSSSAAHSGISIPPITTLSESKRLQNVFLEDLSPTPSRKPGKHMEVSLEDLYPKELLNLSVQLLSQQHIERAIPIMQLALSKDPDYTQCLVLMGQILMQKGMLTEAIEYLERAISKLLLAEELTEVEEIDYLIFALQMAGSLYICQGKLKEGLVHLERIGRLKEPEDPISKTHYFDGILKLSSALYNVGRRDEAAYYLRLAAAYNPAFNIYLEQCENEDDSLISDLANSRRQDY